MDVMPENLGNRKKYAIKERLYAVKGSDLERFSYLKGLIMKKCGFGRNTLSKYWNTGLYSNEWMDDKQLWTISEILGINPKDLLNYDPNDPEYWRKWKQKQNVLIGKK